MDKIRHESYAAIGSAWKIKCVLAYSQQQAQEIVKHIPYVVGMRQAIGDEAARKFAQGFYRAIWDDRSIEDAFLSGKNAIELEGIPEELTPVLLKRADVPKPPPHPWRIIARLRTGLFISLGTTIAISLTRFTGILQPLELNVYDYTLRSRPAEKPDPRLLIVTVTEADLQLQTQAQEPRRGSLSDRSLAQLLETLASDRPIAIGLDIYRDFPVSKSEPALANRLRAKDSAPSIVGVCQVSDADHGDPGVAPPPELS